jgi:hypothetical protein
VSIKNKKRDKERENERVRLEVTTGKVLYTKRKEGGEEIGSTGGSVSKKCYNSRDGDRKVREWVCLKGLMRVGKMLCGARKRM